MLVLDTELERYTAEISHIHWLTITLASSRKTSVVRIHAPVAVDFVTVPVSQAYGRMRVFLCVVCAGKHNRVSINMGQRACLHVNKKYLENAVQGRPRGGYVCL